jgi:ribosome-binding protein aMBF1 (putative translation factor)
MARKKFSTAFAAVVRKHRQQMGLSQEELAKRADIHRTERQRSWPKRWNEG